MEKVLIEHAVDSALDMLLRNDSELLLNDANERSISHRLAIYLEQFFPGWNIDCEYNRDHDDPKRLNIQRRNTTSDDIQATTVFPDIIIHKRKSDDNLVVIELKKTTSHEKDSYDLGKLHAFKNQLMYKYAISIKLKTDGNESCLDRIEWI